ncbi:MAG TPA: hypothetical protein VL727_02385, partial [Puia sp.]|nr:hypothetical protein [Puia sp.]
KSVQLYCPYDIKSFKAFVFKALDWLGAAGQIKEGSKTVQPSRQWSKAGKRQKPAAPVPDHISA